MDNPSTAIGVGLVIVVAGVILAGLVLLVVNLTGRTRRPEDRFPILCDAAGCMRKLIVPADIFHDAQRVTEHSTLTGAGWTAVPIPLRQGHAVRTYCPLHSTDEVTS